MTLDGVETLASDRARVIGQVVYLVWILALHPGQFQ
jgi:hypothetical protein